MKKVPKVGQIERGKKPFEEKETESIFDTMEPGDSRYYEGSRNGLIIKFGYWCAKGLYRTEKEGDGWRFYLLKKPKK